MGPLLDAAGNLTKEGRELLEAVFQAAIIARFQPPLRVPLPPLPRPDPPPFNPVLGDGDPSPQPNLSFSDVLIGEMLLHNLQTARKVGTEWPLAKAIEQEGLEKKVLEETRKSLNASLQMVDSELKRL